MTEALLIEIATRFRRLEDIVETADAFYAARIERLTRKMERLYGDYIKHQNYARFCSETNEVKEARERIEVARQDIDRALESCRDDMVTMQDYIRKSVSA